jgi:hypothetical protein
MKRLARLRELQKSRVTVEIRGQDQGGGGTWNCIYHEEPLSAEQVERIQVEYQEMKLREKPELRADEVKVRVDPELATVERPLIVGVEYGREANVGYG